MMNIKKNIFLRYSLPLHTQGLSSNGFTLVEVLIAMAIFSIGILAVAQMQISAVKGNASARMVTDSVVQATDKIELLLLQPYDHADLTPGLHTGVASAGYTIVWIVSDDTPVEGNKTIAVTVAHTGINSNKSFTIEQIKSEIN